MHVHGYGDNEEDTGIKPKYRKIEVDLVKKPSYSKFHSKIAINWEDTRKEAIGQELGRKTPKEIFDVMSEGLFEMISNESNLFCLSEQLYA